MEDRAYLEGFKDVILIEDEKIILMYKEYKLQLEGKKLRIAAFSKSELILFGVIDRITFHYDV